MKLTKQDKTEILKLYACGYSACEIAKKFNVSHTAISKILNNEKSCNYKEKVSEKFQQNSKQNNHELAKRITDIAMASTLEDITKCSPMDRIRIVERLHILYGDNENQKSALDRVIDAITGVINED